MEIGVNLWKGNRGEFSDEIRGENMDEYRGENKGEDRSVK